MRKKEPKKKPTEEESENWDDQEEEAQPVHEMHGNLQVAIGGQAHGN